MAKMPGEYDPVMDRARLLQENEQMRSALITWRNAFETGRMDVLRLAYDEGDAALGVPPSFSLPPAKVTKLS
jgi:hypothetical protein